MCIDIERSFKQIKNWYKTGNFCMHAMDWCLIHDASLNSIHLLRSNLDAWMKKLTAALV
eukprot:c31602_g1_i1 orf=56-232(-)